MENTQDRNQAPSTIAGKLLWHKPVLQRIEISSETRFGGKSFDDGDGFESILDVAG